MNSREKCLELFKERGGVNFRSLKCSDVLSMIRIYDKLTFSGELSEYEFNCVLDVQESSGVFMRSYIQEGTIILEMRPLVLFSLVHRKTFPNLFEGLVYSLEHELIHVLMIVFGYAEKERENPTIYGEHGKLFECMLKRFFPLHRDIFHPEIVEDYAERTPSPTRTPSTGRYTRTPVSKTPSPLKDQEKGFFMYNENSCYLDSLLIVMFYGFPSFYRKIFSAPIENVKVSSICSEDAKIKTDASLKILIEGIQNQLEDDYQRLQRKEVFVCSQLRKFLQWCIPELKDGEHWEKYNVSAIYNLFVQMFPLLLIPIEKIVHYSNKPSKRFIESIPMLQMWDFMDPLTDVESTYTEYNWNTLQSDVIVFQNGVVPPVQNFSSPEEEFFTVQYGSDDEGPSFKFHRSRVDGSQVIRKKRVFSERIIDEKYELFGIVTLKGVSKGSGGGAHYVCYVKSDGIWYLYDDLGPSMTQVEFDEKYLNSGRGTKPELFFYRRVDADDLF